MVGFFPLKWKWLCSLNVYFKGNHKIEQMQVYNTCSSLIPTTKPVEGRDLTQLEFRGALGSWCGKEQEWCPRLTARAFTRRDWEQRRHTRSLFLTHDDPLSLGNLPARSNKDTQKCHLTSTSSVRLDLFFIIYWGCGVLVATEYKAPSAPNKLWMETIHLYIHKRSTRWPPKAKQKHTDL